MSEAKRREDEDRQMAGRYENQREQARTMGDLRATMSDQEILDMIQADWDRRMSTRWGRFLLWLLRKTT